jgi:hypothetical protein
MAIEPYVRVADRLTNKNFIDAEQWDFEFNKITNYINTKLLPELNLLFDIQVLKDPNPNFFNCYLYEDDTNNLIWKKPAQAGLFLNYLAPPISTIAFIGQNKDQDFLTYLNVDYRQDGVVVCKNNNSFEITKITDQVLDNNIFDNNNFASNSILIDKLSLYQNTVGITITAPSSINSFSRFKIVKDYISFAKYPNYITRDGLKSQKRPTHWGEFDYPEYSQKNTHCRNLPEGLFGAGAAHQLTEYKINLLDTYTYIDVSKRTMYGRDVYQARFQDLMPLVNIAQALYDPDDYAKNAMFGDGFFSILSLSLKPPLYYSSQANSTISSDIPSVGSSYRTEKDYFKMNIPARCFANNSIGIAGATYDIVAFSAGQKFFTCLPPSNSYDDNAIPTYTVDNLLKAETISYDFVDDGIIDISFFPKKIQDKINNPPVR